MRCTHCKGTKTALCRRTLTLDIQKEKPWNYSIRDLWQCFECNAVFDPTVQRARVSFMKRPAATAAALKRKTWRGPSIFKKEILEDLFYGIRFKEDKPHTDNRHDSSAKLGKESSTTST